jgi:beta-mannosidase
MTTRRLALVQSAFELRDMPVETGDPVLLAAEPSTSWLPALVPGGVHESLIAAGVIPDPYYGDNEAKAEWIQEREWWYRARVEIPDQGRALRKTLTFEGLDTVADVWLDGTHLGHHENQFTPAVFDLPAGTAGVAVLLVRFSPPLLGRQVPPIVQDMVAKQAAQLAELELEVGAFTETDDRFRAVTLRKAAFSWGWDFAPNLPSIGIWRPVILSIEPSAVLTGHHIQITELSAERDRATVRVSVEADLRDAGAATATATLTSPGGRHWSTAIALDADGRGEGSWEVPDPELWWTHDLGDPALHDLTIELTVGGVVVDALTDRVGLRTLELDRRADPAEHARLFQFVLNGVPIFARGANWVPASMFVGSVSAATHADRIRRVREANFTMLRVWGGGVYEQDSFYAACDAEGVLLWHDFMFANADYPADDPGLRDEVQQEAEYQVRRLRNRASLALWCGNNEILMSHGAERPSDDEADWGWTWYHELLPAAVAKQDGVTPYWPGSPYGEDGPLGAMGTTDGDRHTWEVWHGLVIPAEWGGFGPDSYPTVGDARHYRRYADDTSRFVSEFGIHASPDMSTLQRWIPAKDLTVHSPTLDRHNKDTPKNKGDQLLSVTTGIPADLGEYIEFTQAVQAEGMRFAIEHYRRRQPHTSGALIWQFNDVWPGFSWSIVDYDGVPKAAFYAAARASAPVATSFRDREDGGLELWLVNNSLHQVDLELDVELGRFDGTVRAAQTAHGSAASGSSVVVWSIGPADLPRDAAHYAWVSDPSGTVPTARAHFAEIGQLELGPSHLEVTVEGSSLRVRATGYSYGVRIEQPDGSVRLSDNWFDLRDGDERVIDVAGADPAALVVSSFPRKVGVAS